ncbi:neutral and basic amino acid transport protein rBAT isoform X2 [Venturia canescens]|uniref:neutral and basic amino acid transport protein rBAT isoform X2 n=1 Tax=Venturia canescens TaxID=32260 RepID=UPI001C9CDBE5|nr:neutral and basic amino acid transport protein rBAT isoform X2 [Venturia canescens]
MESGRLDLESVTGATTNGTKEPVASYKPLPDDSNWPTNKQSDSDKVDMGKLNEETGMDDGAQEKMLNEASNIVPAKEPTEVKFISENGDAKIDIEMVKKTLSGMGKEELMKYANDPFWIRLRWFLFIGFWVLWAAMLGGAIAIIVMAPKCAAPQPKTWWEESPIVQLEASDVEGKDLNGITTLLESLKDQHIKVVSLSHFIDVNGHIKDFRDVQPQVGTIAEFDNIIKAAKDHAMRVVLELDPNHSSVEHPWFIRSIKRKDPYTNYYVWADQKTDPSGTRQPPNNWLSVNGGSAWEWNEQRGQFYLHQFNKTQPDLNFNNPAVVAEFGEIFSHWLQRGVSGFRLGNTQYLTEDPNLKSESFGTVPANADEYQYLTHVHTYGRLENGEILRQWREIVTNRTNGDCLFTLREKIGADILAVYNEKKTLIDLPKSSLFLETANETVNATTLFNGVRQSIATSGDWPSWDLNGNERSLRKRMPREVADSLTLMTLLLPGTPILKLNDTLSAKDAFSKIAKSRDAQTFLYGKTETSIVNGTVFVYLRLKSGTPGYLVAYQSSDKPAVIDLSTLMWVSSEVNVLAHSPNYSQGGTEIMEKLPSDRVPISPKSTLVMTFVPKE